MADFNGCSSFGDLAPEIHIDKVERLPDQGRNQVAPNDEVETIKARLSFRQTVKNQAQKFWFDQEESLAATNIRVVVTTSPAMTKRMLYLQERIRKFKLSRVNSSQTGLKDLLTPQQPLEIRNLYRELFRNNINPQHRTASESLSPVVLAAAPLGDVQLYDIKASDVIDNRNPDIEQYQDGTEINKKFSFEVDFRFYKSANQSPSIDNNLIGVGKSIEPGVNNGHLSIFAFCYLDLRLFEGLTPRGMTELDPITTGGVNFVNVIGSYDESYFDEGLQRLFDIKYPGSTPIAPNGDFLGRDEGFEGVYARPEDVFYLDPELERTSGAGAADADAQVRAEERSEVLGLGGDIHVHINDDGVKSYMPGRDMRVYNSRVLRGANQNIRPPQVFGPGRELLRDKRTLANVTRPQSAPTLENNLERLFSELTDGIRSFGEKQVNKLFNTEKNYFTNLWATKDHQENIKLMFAFDLTKFIEDNSPVYNLLKRPAFVQIVNSIDYPLYDIKDVRMSRKKVRLRPGTANSLGSGYADDPVEEYNVEEYIGSAKMASINPSRTNTNHADKMLRFFYCKDDMSQEIASQKAGNFQYSAEVSIVDNSALVLKAMLAEIAKDMLEIKSHRVSIDYGGTLFDSNGTVNKSVKERLFLQTSQNVTVLAVFLDALIPREQQLPFLKPIEKGKKQEEPKRENNQLDVEVDENNGQVVEQGMAQIEVEAPGAYFEMLQDLAAEAYSGTIESSLESLDALIDVYQVTQNSLVNLIKRIAPDFTFSSDPGSLSTGLSEGSSQKVKPIKVRKQFEQTVKIGKYYKCGYEYIVPRDTTSENYNRVYNNRRSPGFDGTQFRTMSPVTYGKRTGFERLKFYNGNTDDDSLLEQRVGGIAGSYLTPLSIRAFGGGFAGQGEMFFQGINTRNLYGAYKKLLVDLLELQFGNEDSDYYYLRNTSETDNDEQAEQDANRTASLISALSRGSFSFVFPKAFNEEARRGQGNQGNADDVFGVREQLDEGDDNFRRARNVRDEFNDIGDEEREVNRDRQKALEKEDRNIKESFASISDRTLFSMFKQFVMTGENEALRNVSIDSIAKVSKRFAEGAGIEEPRDLERNRAVNRLPLALRAMIEMSLGINSNNVRLPLLNVDKDEADRLRNQDRFNSLFVSIPDRQQPLSVFDPMKDPVKFPAFWLNHKQLVRVEYLDGFYSTNGGERNYSIKDEAWRPLPLEVLFGGRAALDAFVQRFNRQADRLEELGVQSEVTQEFIAGNEAQRRVNISEEDYFICRLVPYTNPRLGVKKIDTFDLPIYDQYFILHHGFNYIDQFEGLVETRDPERIELVQVPPPPEPEFQPPQPAPERARIGANEEENQNMVGMQLRNVAQQIRIPTNISPQQLLSGLNSNAGSPPPSIRRKNNIEEVRVTPQPRPAPEEVQVQAPQQIQLPQQISPQNVQGVRDVLDNLGPGLPGGFGGGGFGGGGGY